MQMVGVRTHFEVLSMCIKIDIPRQGGGGVTGLTPSGGEEMATPSTGEGGQRGVGILRSVQMAE